MDAPHPLTRAERFRITTGDITMAGLDALLNAKLFGTAVPLSNYLQSQCVTVDDPDDIFRCTRDMIRYRSEWIDFPFCNLEYPDSDIIDVDPIVFIGKCQCHLDTPDHLTLQDCNNALAVQKKLCQDEVCEHLVSQSVPTLKMLAFATLPETTNLIGCKNIVYHKDVPTLREPVHCTGVGEIIFKDNVSVKYRRDFILTKSSEWRYYYGDPHDRSLASNRARRVYEMQALSGCDCEPIPPGSSWDDAVNCHHVNSGYGWSRRRHREWSQHAMDPRCGEFSHHGRYTYSFINGRLMRRLFRKSTRRRNCDLTLLGELQKCRCLFVLDW